jgi:hypothetical protein
MLMPWTHRVALRQREVAMRPARTITAVVFVAAIAVTGCAAHSTAVNPKIDGPAPVPVPEPNPIPVPVPVPVPNPNPTPKAPVLADGHYDAYVRQVDSGRDRLVVDLVQVFHDQAAVNEAIADGQSRDAAQYLSTYVRNENPRLRTLTLAGNVRVELLGGDCEAPLSHKLSELAAHARSGANSNYYALTVTGGAVQRIQELRTGNAC